jgi:hypothetical protein
MSAEDADDRLAAFIVCCVLTGAALLVLAQCHPLEEPAQRFPDVTETIEIKIP